MLALSKVINHDPAVEHVFAYTGGTGANNAGALYIALKPDTQRNVNANQIVDRLRPQLDRLPVAAAFLQAIQDLRVGGRNTNARYQYTIHADNIQDLAHWGPILLANMKKLPGFQDVNTDQQNSGLQERLNYDRTTAARLGQNLTVAGPVSLQRLRPSGGISHLHPAQPVLCSP